MTIIKDVSDAIQAVSGTINGLQAISEAIKNGRNYLKTKHPHVAGDLVIMCEEMRKSSHTLAVASSIITNFRFVVGENNAKEAARFNEHLVNQKSEAENVEQNLNSMRGHCHIIQEHSTHIQNNANPKGLATLAAVLGLHSVAKEQELAKALQEIYDEEMQYHSGVYRMADAIKCSLNAIQDELGPPGVIDPNNVPAAAKALGEYAVAFSKLESECKNIALELQESINILRRN